MWSGVFPAVTTKFEEDDGLDHAEMERCFGLQMDAGCDGIIVCGSLGEGPMLSDDEKLAVFDTARRAAAGKPVLMTHQRSGDPRCLCTRQESQQGRRRRADDRSERDLSHQQAGNRCDSAGGGRSRRSAGDDLFKPRRLPCRRDARHHGRTRKRRAVCGDQGIVR